MRVSRVLDAYRKGASAETPLITMANKGLVTVTVVLIGPC